MTFLATGISAEGGEQLPGISSLSSIVAQKKKKTANYSINAREFRRNQAPFHVGAQRARAGLKFCATWVEST